MCKIRNISFFKKNDYNDDQILALIFGNSLDVINDSWSIYLFSFLYLFVRNKFMLNLE